MKNRLIVYVDDESDLGEIFTQEMHNRGYQVTFFSDPRKAIEFMKANRESIDLAFVDYRLPGMTGIDLILEVNLPCQVHIITGDLLAAKLIKDTRITSILFKPFSFSDVEKILKAKFGD